MAGLLTECAIEVRYDKREDGRFTSIAPTCPVCIWSAPIPDALTADLEPVLREMLRVTTSQAIDTMMVLPSFETLGGYARGSNKREIRVVTFRQA